MLKQLEKYKTNKRIYHIPSCQRLKIYKMLEDEGWDFCVDDPKKLYEFDMWTTGDYSEPLEIYLNDDQELKFIKDTNSTRTKLGLPEIPNHLIVWFNEKYTYYEDSNEDPDGDFIKIFWI